MIASLRSGSTFSHYEIIGPLGIGGMGEVYKARDSRLERIVAIKILPPQLVRSEEGLRRFIQEARSASSLSHPHIITIHEIGEAAGSDSVGDPVHYITMEYVDGVTLREKIHDQAESLRTILGYMAQVADGLAKAHSAGIIHRDLKPDNVMVTRDGYAKILDFGLAKLLERDPAQSRGGTTAPTAVRQHTAEGVIMGTVGYMSPEQVQGKAVDHRSDVFSFGCILYEAATKQRPFAADTDFDTMHAIVHRDPPSVSEINAAAPGELRRMVRRCLAKDPDRRYQSMKDLSIELRDLVDEFEQLLPTSGPQTASLSGGNLQPVRERRHLPVFAILAAAILIAVIALVIFSNRPHPPASVSSAPQLEIRTLTDAGKSFYGVISPDGRYLVHVLSDKGKEAVAMRQIATGGEVIILPPSETHYRGLTFSRDGNFLYVTASAKSDVYSRLSVIPALGGAAREMIFDVDSGVSISPDGKSLAFMRGKTRPATDSLMVAAADGTNVREISSRKYPDFFVTSVTPVWSVDGQTIAAAAGTVRGGLSHNIFLYPIRGQSTDRKLIKRPWFLVASMAGLPDGSALVVTGQEKESEQNEVWLFPWSDGEPRRLTNDLNSYDKVSVTADGKSLVTSRRDSRARLWRYPVSGDGQGEPLTSEGDRRPPFNFSVGPDGTIYYMSFATGNLDIWRMTARGERSQLTFHPRADFSPKITRDGSTLYFTTERSGPVELWKMNPEGGSEEKVALLDSDLGYDVSPDGKWIVFLSGADLFRISLTDGTRTKLNPRPIVIGLHGFSPDGKWVACSFRVAQPPNPYRIGYMSADGGEPVRIFDPAPPPLTAAVAFMPDSKGLAYATLENGLPNLWVQPLDGTATRRLTHFDSDGVRNFAWSPDGKSMYLLRGTQVSDMILISNFR